MGENAGEEEARGGLVGWSLGRIMRNFAGDGNELWSGREALQYIRQRKQLARTSLACMGNR